MKPQTSRRKFLKTGCLAAGAAGLVVCGGGGLALTLRPKVELPAASFGEKSSTDRVLVAYGTKAGSTAEVAARIGEEIAAQGRAVDLLPVGKAKDLSAYSAVILGSPIRMSAPLPEVTAFVEKNQAALQQIPFHFFILCMTLEKDTEENRALVSTFLEPVRALVKPASEGMFAGAVLLERLPLLERMMTKSLKSPEGDFRDWEKITAWEQSIAAK